MFFRDPRSRAPSAPLAPPRNARPPLPRIVSALAFALTASLLPASALALTIGANVTRDNPHTENNLYRFWISKADCDSDVEYHFPVVVDQVQGNFELWITSSTSADCTLPEQRTGPTALCFRIPTNKDTVIGNINWPIDVGAKAIASALPDISDDCVDQTNASLPRPVVLYFFQINPGDTTITSYAKYDEINIDLVPPAPPVIDDGKIQSGEGSLTLAYQTPPQGTEQYYLRYDLYCDPPPGSQIGSSGCDCLGNVGSAGTSTSTTTTAAVTTTTDTFLPPPPGDGGMGGTGGKDPIGGAGGTGGSGGAGGSGGSGGASTSGSTTTTAATTTTTTTASGGTGGEGGSECVAGTCESCNIYEGAPAPGQNSAYYCGSNTAISSGTASVNGLQNGTPHVVAIVAVDELGNTSAMSTPVCAIPAEATDFYESYKDRGGQGGGGLCALRPWSTQTSTLGPAGAALAALAFAGRRIARRKRAAATGANR